MVILMEFWDNGSVITNISYVVNILLILSLAFTIWQIKQAIKQHNTEIKNRAIDMALQQSSRFISDFLFLYNEFEQTRESSGVKSYQVVPSKFDKTDFPDDTSKHHQYYDLFLKDHRKTLGNILNILEGISIYFVVGGADKETGYTAIGNDYVNIFEYLYEDIQIVSGYKIQKYIPNTIALYKHWKPKRDNYEQLFK